MLRDVHSDVEIDYSESNAPGASEVAVEAASVTVWTLRDGKISQIKLYQTRADALAAVGLVE